MWSSSDISCATVRILTLSIMPQIFSNNNLLEKHLQNCVTWLKQTKSLSESFTEHCLHSQSLADPTPKYSFLHTRGIFVHSHIVPFTSWSEWHWLFLGEQITSKNAWQKTVHKGTHLRKRLLPLP